MPGLLPARDCQRPPTATERLASYLSVLQLSDSAFPSGRYTLSYGLEAFAQAGLLGARSSPAPLLSLLSDSIRFGVAPSDGVALACAHRAFSADGDVDLELVVEADRRLTAVKLPREARDASARTGRALLNAATVALGAPESAGFAEMIERGNSPGNHAVVLGLVAACLGVGRLEAVAAELYAFTSGWVSAAVRLGLIDHRTAQRLIHETRPVSAEAALDAVRRNAAEISSCTPLLDVVSMRHEQADLRLFAS